jgi:hypothetical protein
VKIEDPPSLSLREREEELMKFIFCLIGYDHFFSFPSFDHYRTSRA